MLPWPSFRLAWQSFEDWRHDQGSVQILLIPVPRVISWTARNASTRAFNWGTHLLDVHSGSNALSKQAGLPPFRLLPGGQRQTREEDSCGKRGLSEIPWIQGHKEVGAAFLGRSTKRIVCRIGRHRLDSRRDQFRFFAQQVNEKPDGLTPDFQTFAEEKKSRSSA
jgi:hypothetical protein